MAFFDEIGKRVSGMGQSAQKLAEQSRLSRKAAGMKGEIDKILLQIGKSYYAQYQSGGGNPDALRQMCAMIDTIHRDIDSLEKQIDEIRQVQRCAKCGAVQSLESKFCATCGNKLDHPRPAPPPIPTEPEETEAPESGQMPAEPLDGAEAPADDEAEDQAPEVTQGDVYIRWPQAAEPEGDPAEQPEDGAQGEPAPKDE